MNTTEYRGIKITDTSNDFEYDRTYNDEVIQGYASTLEQVKEIIDETISFIDEDGNFNFYQDYESKNFSKKGRAFDYEDY